VSPIWLAHLAARQEAAHARFDVEDRRAVDRIEASDLERRSFDRQQATDGHAKPVRPVLAALGKDTDFGQSVRPRG
jgi:hypothetical protein